MCDSGCGYFLKTSPLSVDYSIQSRDNSFNETAHLETIMLSLTRDTYSIINHLLSASCNMPEVGDGATILYGADRKPATVIDVFTKGKHTYAVVQDDTYTLDKEASRLDKPVFNFSRNTNGAEYTFRHSVKGWHQVYLNSNNRYCNARENGVVMGSRERYFCLEI